MNGEQALDALMQDAGLCTRCGFSRCQCEPRKRGNPNFRSLADDERTVRVMVSMPASLRDWLREQPGSSDSERVREVLEAARDREQRDALRAPLAPNALAAGDAAARKRR